LAIRPTPSNRRSTPRACQTAKVYFINFEKIPYGFCSLSKRCSKQLVKRPGSGLRFFRDNFPALSENFPGPARRIHLALRKTLSPTRRILPRMPGTRRIAGLTPISYYQAIPGNLYNST
jgi:hypothetical protein